MKLLALAEMPVDHLAGTAGKSDFHDELLSVTKKAPASQGCTAPLPWQNIRVDRSVIL
jgi:hypothetical protein